MKKNTSIHFVLGILILFAGIISDSAKSSVPDNLVDDLVVNLQQLSQVYCTNGDNVVVEIDTLYGGAPPYDLVWTAEAGLAGNSVNDGISWEVDVAAIDVSLDLEYDGFTLTLLVTDNNGTTAMDQIQVFVGGVPNAYINTIGYVCSVNDTFNLELVGIPGNSNAPVFDMKLYNSNDSLLANEALSPSIVEIPISLLGNEGNELFTLIVTDTNLCSFSTELEVTVENAFNPGAFGSISFCEGQSLVDLESLLGAHDPGGIWIDDDGTGVDLSNPFDVNFENVPTGVYTFTYLFPGTSLCPSVSQMVQIDVIDPSNPQCTVSTNGIEISNQVKLLPNPARSKVVIKWTIPVEHFDMSIYDLQGNLKLRKKVYLNSTVSIDDLKSSVYIIKLNHIEYSIAKILVKV